LFNKNVKSLGLRYVMAAKEMVIVFMTLMTMWAAMIVAGMVLE
jgi:hypothetical protein